MPRPRPRPAIPKPAAAAGPSHNISYDNVKDDDEMFMRNRGGWAKLRKLNKETEQNQKKPTVDKDKDSDSDDSTTRPLKRKGETSPLVRPRWQTDKKYVTRLLSEELSDDSDDSITIQDVQNDHGNNPKRKREPAKRARSKSITPPPAIPQYQLENAREIIRKTLGTHRDSSPDVEDTFEEEETFVLDPQLAKIAQNIKSQSSLAGHTRSSTEPTSNDVVNITVRWEPHPLNGHGTRDVWGFKLDVNENFSELFESVAEEASIMLDKLVMTYRGKRFFSSISPHTLNIWSDAEFIACDLPTFEYKRRVAEEQLSSQAQPLTHLAKPKDTSNVVEIDSDSDDQSAVGPSAQNNRGNEEESETEAMPVLGPSEGGRGAGEDEDDQDKFKLVLRSGLTSNTISLNVRSTTKCGAIIKAFLKKAGLADKYTTVFEPEAAMAPQKKTKARKSAVADIKIPKLSIDGDKAGNETEIGEYGLEDGDMVEVVDL
ncbi:hypothetical protein GYMLUDRAFT_254979 [Collybiopsis luxurians FD-317 M1]|nr:hypothetical protein GYMLUDRAFT_254979 [Collybiopsis luxurians FD-317 M1]